MQIIPAVDVLDGAVVRLERGRFDRVTVYGDDPASVVRGFGEEGAAIVHVVDLAGARSGVPSPGLWEMVSIAGTPVEVGGAIRDAATAAAAISAGVTRVVVGSAAVWDPGELAAIVASVGGERVVVAIDVADGMAKGSGWEDAGRPALDVASDAVAAGAGRLMVTAVERDGMMTGPDTNLLDEVARAVDVPVIASGGVGSLDHIRTLAATGVEAAIVGKAFYEGLFTAGEAIAAAQEL
ncbi:1-(5-phosphoribosyl)-5-[(5-phosphoribosylamino)methylideneamino] imidazole-4-carboxamide isomerase [bacterium]|nr:1-(5-phosphoribosyl)-5-[(5-phosphoribosylamino)methylideneamino] imidazole-4-carboxamide isomerase [bacterium]